MARPTGRLEPPRDPVTITFDGEPILAERGEPVAAALIAAGKVAVARSPKFHRPRGPSCFRAACDGCLARVDETPNVMTCLTAARDGMTIRSQNRLGPRDADLLRMTDWFFPDGMNHHELFAGVPGVQTVMQAFARKVAGLGKLPHDAEAPRRAARREADVVVVGAGPAGMAVATCLAEAGRRVEILDDQLEEGGGLRALAGDYAAPFAHIRASYIDAVSRGGVSARAHTVAGGLYGRDLLVVGPEGAEVLSSKALVLACGAHDGVLAFEGNELPGVMSARAAGILLGRGVVPGARVVVVVAEGGGPFGASFAADLARRAPSILVELVTGEPVHAKGSSRVKAIVVRTASGERELAADAVIVDAPRSPAYELALQAGAELSGEPRGFVVRARDGRVAEGVFAVGEMVGGALDARDIADGAAAAAAAVLQG